MRPSFDRPRKVGIFYWEKTARRRVGWTGLEGDIMRAIMLGAVASLFFATTFVWNRAMELSGGSWLYSASLRYLFTAGESGVVDQQIVLSVAADDACDTLAELLCRCDI